MKSEELVLKNGIKVLFINAPGSTASTIQCWFKAGSALEKKSEQGIAHFLEHMFFKGTKKRSGNKLASDVESFGGELNAFTSFDYTCYFINCPTSKIIKSTDILMDMISNPVFSEKDIAPERGVVYEEYRRAIDSSSQYSFLKMQENFFRYGYKHPILGTEKTIKNFSRDQLIDFRNRYYSSENFLLVIAGDLSKKKQLINKIEQFKLPKGIKVKRPKFSFVKDQAIEIHKKETTMCQLTLCISGKNYSDRLAPAEDLAMNCLGHGETSRFHKGIVLDQTLANYASASTMYMSDGSGHFIRFSFPESNSKIVFDRIISILKEAQKNGFNKDEIIKLQNQYIASKIYEKESVEGFAFTLGNSFVQTDDYFCEEKFITQIQEETHISVHEGLKNILKREIHLSLQLPLESNENKITKELNSFNSSLKKLKTISNSKTSKINIEKSKFDPQTSLVTLKKGVKLLHRQSKLTPTFTLHAYIRGGLTEETKTNNGIYNILATLLPKGHKDSTNDELREYFENQCASISGFSGKNAYGMTLHGLTKDMKQLTDHFFKSLLYPKFDKDILNHEIEISQRVIQNQQEEPTKFCFDKFHSFVFGDHPYSYNVLGSEKSLKSLTVEKLNKLHKADLKNKEILLTYCGNQNLQTVLASIEKYVDTVSERVEKIKRSTKKIAAQTGQKAFIKFDREQTHIMLGIPTKHLGHKENVYLKMLTAHLAGQSSELFSILRDKMGLCYSAQPVNFQALEGSYWGIYVACGHDKVSKTIEETKKIVNQISLHGISKSEFNKIKTMISGQQELNIQTNDDYANLYSIPTFQNLGIDYFYQATKSINDMTYDKFQKEIKKILKVEANIVIVGQKSD